MIITKGSVVYLYNNIPLTKDYTDTMYFDSIGAQTSAFASMAHLNVSNYSYIAPGENTFRVDLGNANTNENLYTYNYIAFQNPTFGGKWWYAFIDSVRYINNACYEITYTIDVFQSFLFEVDWTTQVYVEREHSTTDELFGNTVDEGLNTGELMYYDQTDLLHPHTPIIVIACSVDEENNDAEGDMYGLIYSGVKYNVFQTSNVDGINDFISGLTDNNKSSAIVSIFMAYNEYFVPTTENDPPVLLKSMSVITDSISGYVPRNKKLFNYPFNYVSVISPTGENMDIRPEFVDLNDSNEISFIAIGDTSAAPSISLYVGNYLGYTGTNNRYKMVLSGFPQCAYTIDSFRAYLAQNAASIATGVLTTAGGIALTLATGGVGAVAGGAMILSGSASIIQTINTVAAESRKPPQASGGSSSGTLFNAENLTFTGYHVQLTQQMARIIDSFFTKYGYATKRTKQANRSARPYWNYVETREANYHGSVPAEFMSQINSAMNRGVTFWKNFSYIGNYSLDNSPQ